VLAAHHAALENNYLELGSLRRIMGDVRSPVLVVGAGQGLIVAELKNRGFQCDGVDFSAEMIRYARLRRGLDLIQADAKAMPLKSGSYQTIIYATGVIDFTSDEADIKRMLVEAKRIVDPDGKILVAFYRLSPTLEDVLAQLGLLRNHRLAQRDALQIHGFNLFQLLRWMAKQEGLGYLRAALLFLRMSAFSTLQEKTIGFSMKKIFRKVDDLNSLIDKSPEQQPYRNEAEIRNLFGRLGIATKKITTLRSCTVALL